MENLITLIKIIAIFTAAIILGNWFLSEAKRCKRRGDPPHKAYLSPPGIIIALIIVALPIVIWILRH